MDRGGREGTTELEAGQRSPGAQSRSGADPVTDVNSATGKSEPRGLGRRRQQLRRDRLWSTQPADGEPSPSCSDLTVPAALSRQSGGAIAHRPALPDAVQLLQDDPSNWCQRYETARAPPLALQRSRTPHRNEDYSVAPPIAATVRELGFGLAVASPIVWGATRELIFVLSCRPALPRAPTIAVCQGGARSRGHCGGSSVWPVVTAWSERRSEIECQLGVRPSTAIATRTAARRPVPAFRVIGVLAGEQVTFAVVAGPVAAAKANGRVPGDRRPVRPVVAGERPGHGRCARSSALRPRKAVAPR